MDQRRGADTFARRVRRFCHLVERAPALGAAGLLRRLHAVLPDLYAAALRLPDAEPATAAAPAGAVDQERWSVIFDGIWDVLGPHDVYWTVYDPAERDEPVAGSIADDLADTYRDLLEGLSLLDAGAPLADVLWTWRFSFQSHWGRHVLDALRATHWLVTDGRIGQADTRSVDTSPEF